MSKNKKKAKLQKKQSRLSNKKIGIMVAVAAVVVIAAGAMVYWQKNRAVDEKLDYDPAKYVKIGEYKGVQVSLEVTDEDIQDEIDNVREDNASYEQLTGTTQTGQTIRASFEGYVDGKKMDDTCGQRLRFCQETKLLANS